jgi:hypothetical protein
VNELLAIRCAAQGGVFTRADALEFGYDDGALRQLVRSGACRRLARGVYGVCPPDLDAEDRHRLLTRGLVRRIDGAAASHHSALLLHGLPVYSVDLGRAHVVGQSPRKVRRLPEATVHRRVPDALRGAVDGISCVDVGVALVQNALLHDTVSAVVSADAALHRKIVTRHELESNAAAVSRQTGSGTVTEMVRLADGRSESVGESRLRLIFGALGIPVTPQFTITDGEGGPIIARTDFKVVGAPVLIEFDGLVKYKGQGGPQVLAREKRREDLVRDLDYEFARFIWVDLDRPPLIGHRVNTAMERARRRGLC